MIDINESLASLRAKAEEVSKVRDASALLRLKNPDDATFLESLNSANEELAAIEASITLFEASHRAEFIHAQQKITEQRKKEAEESYAKAITCSNQLVELAPQIEKTIEYLGSQLEQWFELVKARKEASGNVVEKCSRNHAQLADKGLLVSGIANGYLSSPFAYHISKTRIRDALGSCGNLELTLHAHPATITEVTMNNAYVLKGELDKLIEVFNESR